jgi:ATP:corrinoid adenosyltransferase
VTPAERRPAQPPPRARERLPSRVLVHTGDGKGMTSAAMGIVMRDVADTVTEMASVKHPFDRGVAAMRGIEY